VKRAGRRTGEFTSWPWRVESAAQCAGWQPAFSLTSHHT
jgi:hypothetical protein